MLFKRTLITSSGQDLPAKSRSGTGFLDNPTVAAIATDANVTLTTTQMAGGVITLAAFTAGRNVTTPTAAAILAEATDMDIGDAFMIQVATLVAFAGTWVAGVGVTLVGRATIPASSNVHVIITKTSATAVTWTVV